MILLVRRRLGYINFIHNVDEFRQFIFNYVPGSKVLIGDLSYFNKPMKNMLLKFLEDNPLVDCYSSTDLDDSIILSRFVQVRKEPLILTSANSLDDFKNSNKDFSSVEQDLSGFSTAKKLMSFKASNRVLDLIEAL